MTFLTTDPPERRNADAHDQARGGDDPAGRLAVQEHLSPAAPVLTAPRCGEDRERPRLKSTIEVMPDRDRLVLLRTGHRDGDRALEGDPEVLLELLAQLDGTRGRAEILAALRAGPVPALSAADLDAAIDAMVADGLVEDAAQDADHLDRHALQRYDRQLRYFGDLAAPGASRAAAQRALQDATVVVLGLGGLGGMAATMLAVCGVGTLVGVDDDTVELSNLARQIMYSMDDLGRLKADATRERLGAMNPRTNVITMPRRMRSTGDIVEVVTGADFVVDAIDWPATHVQHWVNAACWQARVPFISMSVFPPVLRVGPTYVPGETGCLECQDAAYRRQYPYFEQAVASLDDASPGATYAPACGLIGSLVANEVIAHLTGLHAPACHGKAYMIDITTLSVRSEDVPREPGCPVCDPDRSSMRPGG
jgi:bacteriocin biosynthesis cyclodehydratase domain-containing protein